MRKGRGIRGKINKKRKRRQGKVCTIRQERNRRARDKSIHFCFAIKKRLNDLGCKAEWLDRRRGRERGGVREEEVCGRGAGAGSRGQREGGGAGQ